MANVTNKQNLVISIREYTDSQGNTKKVWKTIGELITWDDGKQSFELWGPTGSTRGNVFEQDNQQQQQQPQQPQQQAYRPQQGYQGQPQGYQGQLPQGNYQYRG